MALWFPPSSHPKKDVATTALSAPAKLLDFVNYGMPGCES